MFSALIKGLRCIVLFAPYICMHNCHKIILCKTNLQKSPVQNILRDDYLLDKSLGSLANGWQVLEFILLVGHFKPLCSNLQDQERHDGWYLHWDTWPERDHDMARERPRDSNCICSSRNHCETKQPWTHKGLRGAQKVQGVKQKCMYECVSIVRAWDMT